MTDEQDAPPVPRLAGHLVIYDDAIAFRPDGGTDDQVIVRPVIGIARDHMAELLSPGPGGLLAAVLAGDGASMLKSMGGPKAALKALSGNHG